MKAGFYIASILLLFTSITMMSSKEYSYEVIKRDDNVYRGKIHCGMEDSRGFIWLGTSNGLFRYDGRESVEFTGRHSDTASIADNVVTDIIEDKSGFLWVSNESGKISRLDPVTGKFRRFRLFDSEKNMASIVVMRPFTDSTGRVWYSGFTRTNTDWFLAFFNNEKDKFEFYHFYNDYVDSVFKNGPNIPQFIPGSNGDIIVKNLFFQRSAKLDTSVSPGGEYRLLVFNPYKKTYRLLNNYKDYDYEKFIGNDGKGNVLIEVHTDEEPFRAIKLNLGNYQYSETGWKCDKRWYRKGFMVTSGWFDNEMFFTVKVIDGVSEKKNEGICGFYRFDDNKYLAFDKKGQIHSQSMIARAKTFYWKNKFFGPTNSIIWDYFSNGLVKVFPRTKKVTTVHLPSEGNNIYDNSITAVFVDSLNNIWAGSQYGLYKYTMDGRIKHFSYPYKNPVNRKNRIKAITEDGADKLIVGTDNGILYFDKDKGSFRDYNKANSLEPYNEILLNSYIRCIMRDEEGLWTGSLYGLRRHLKKTNTIKFYVPDDSDKASISDYIITCLYKDNNNTVWIGTTNGLNRYIPENDGFKVYRNGPKDEFSICGNEIRSICEDREGNLWVASYGFGLNKYNPKGDNFTTIKESDGLPFDEISSILFDRDDNLWLGTDNGLIKYEKTTGKYTVFNKQDGFQGDEYNINSAALTHDNNLVFGGYNGLSVFYPDELQLNTHIPKIVITKLIINDSLVSYYLKDGDTISKNWNADYLKIHFAALDYISPELNRYAFRIDGVHNDWVDLGSQNSVIIAGIEPGQYRLRIRGSNNDGIWNKKGISLFVNIVPPFWMTAWFKASAIFFAGGIIAVVMFVRIREKKQKEITKRRLIVSQLKALQAQMNPHFIFNSLNSILNLILQNENELSTQYLGKFSKLLRNILENSRSLSVYLSREIEYLRMYLELESLRYDNKINYQIDWDKNIDPDNIKIPSLLIQPYVENSIRHGQVAAVENGMINIYFQMSGDYLICEITDNGIGRQKSIENKAKAKYIHKSLGMAVNRERLGLLNSRVEIEDLYHDDGSPAGTKVILMLNLRNDLMNDE